MPKIEVVEQDEAASRAGETVMQQLKLDAHELFSPKKAFKILVGAWSLGLGIMALQYPELGLRVAGIAGLLVFTRLSFGSTTGIYLTDDSQKRLEAFLKTVEESKHDTNTTEVP
jgi:hypothetical protein